MKKLFLFSLVSLQIYAMQEKKEFEEFSRCRFSYFLEHQKLPDSDHDLYRHFIKILTFLNAVSKQYNKKVTHLVRIEGGQTRTGLFLTSSTPPQIITPWGRWFTYFIDEEESFDQEQKEKYWFTITKFLMLDQSIKAPWPKSSFELHPILSYWDSTGDNQLPTPIMRPLGEFEKLLPCLIHTHKLHSWLQHSPVVDNLLMHLDRQYHVKQMTLVKLCLKAIKKYGLEMDGLPKEL